MLGVFDLASPYLGPGFLLLNTTGSAVLSFRAANAFDRGEGRDASGIVLSGTDTVVR